MAYLMIPLHSHVDGLTKNITFLSIRVLQHEVGDFLYRWLNMEATSQLLSLKKPLKGG